MAENYLLLGCVNDRKCAIRCLDLWMRLNETTKLLSVDIEGTVIIYDNYQLEHKFQTGCPLYSCVWQTRHRFILGDKSGAVSIYDYLESVATLTKKVNVSNQIISSISVENDFIACGSWDGYVYCYDGNMDTLLWKSNRNLRFAVCVKIVYDIVYAGSQAGILLGFDAPTGLLTYQKEAAHVDIIRRIRWAQDEEGISWLVTCSNDGMVKLWDYELQESASTSANETGSFCFDVVGDDCDFAITASDDGSICLVEYSTNLIHQLMQVECTVWCLEQNCDGAVFAGTDSGELLIFGKQNLKLRWKLPEGTYFTVEDREARLARGVAHMAQKAKQEEADNAQDISKLPAAADRHLHPGRKVGQTSLFTEAGEVKVYQWSGREWIYIGEMMGSANKQGASTIGEASKIYEGDEFFPAGQYDYIFDVEIDQRPGDAPRLPYNVGQNTLDVAARFCALHNLPKSNIQDIVAFIKQNAPEYSVGPSLSAEAVDVVSPPTLARVCDHQMIVFNAPAKWASVIDKIRELDANHNSKIEELAILDSIQASVSRPDFLKGAAVKMSEVHFLFAWPNEHFSEWPDPYPILDLCRFYIINPDAIQKIRQHNMVVNILQFVTTMIRKKANNSTLMGLRLLTNMLSVQSLRENVLNTLDLILKTVVKDGSLASNLSAIALMSLCHNSALAIRLAPRTGQVDSQRNSDLKATIRLVMTTVAASSSVSTIRAEIEKLL